MVDNYNDLSDVPPQLLDYTIDDIIYYNYWYGGHGDFLNYMFKAWHWADPQNKWILRQPMIILILKYSLRSEADNFRKKYPKD